MVKPQEAGVPDFVDQFEGIDSIGFGCRISKSISIWRRGSLNKESPKINIQSDVILFPNVRIILPNESEFESFDEYLKTGVYIGNKVIVNVGTYLSGEGGLKIEDEVLIGANACILTGGHDIDGNNESIYHNSLTNKPVQISKGAWLGAACVVLPGCSIGKGAVVAAGAVVTKDVPDFAVVAGNPARILRYRKVAADNQTPLNNDFYVDPHQAEFMAFYKLINNYKFDSGLAMAEVLKLNDLLNERILTELKLKEQLQSARELLQEIYSSRAWSAIKKIKNVAYKLGFK